MPLGYGPSPGPRQSAQGSPLSGWDAVKSTTYTVAFQAPKAQLATFLPGSCFRIESPGDISTASVSFTRLENLPWLAGHGYNYCGLYIHNVVCRGTEEEVSGKYLSVLFENRADPITSGREELGFAKVYATIDEHIDAQHAGDVTIQLGWEGAVFGEIRIPGTAAKQDSTPTETIEKAAFQPCNILHYKYIPRTGCPGVADVEYPTVSPVPSMSTASVEDAFYTSGPHVCFKDLGFAKLPTLHHIAAKLAGIEVLEILGAQTVVAMGGSDYGSQRPILV
jgi:hypothetical protein